MHSLKFSLFFISLFFFQITSGQEVYFHLKQSMEMDGENKDEYRLDESSLLDLNNTTETEIESLYFLTAFQKQALWNYLQKHRPLRSMYELHYILGFTKDDAKRLASVSVLTSPQYIDTIKHPLSHTLIARTGTVEKKVDGEIDETYYGYPRVYSHVKYSLRNRHFRAGIAYDVDRGESPFQKGAGLEPEYLSLYGQIDKGKSRFIVGDYDIRFAQGLVAWNGFGLSKGFANTNIRKSSTSVVPHTSSDENDYCKGFAYKYHLKKLEVTIAVSENHKDGAIKGDDVVSYKTSGLHVVQSDIDTKDNLKHNLYGGKLKYRTTHSELGFQIINHTLSDISQPDSIQKSFSQTLGSIDFALKKRKAIVFGEYAMDNAQEIAVLSGLQLSPLAGVEWSLLHRYYAPNYRGHISNAFSEYSGVNNEHGVYTAILLNGFSKFEITSNYDYFINPQPQFRQSYGSVGKEWSISPKYQMSESVRLWGRYAFQSKEYDRKDSLNSNLYEQKRKSVYIKCNVLVHTMSVTLGGAFAKTNSGEGEEHGFLVFLQIQQNLGAKCRVMYQTVRHNTTYLSRLYLYDPHLHNRLYVPAYIGNGYRNTVRLQYKLKHFDGIVKYAYQSYINAYKEVPDKIEKQSIDVGLLLRF